MSATQYFPIPSELFALVCETVSRRVSRLPFSRNEVMVTGEILGVAMECLNAEFNKTLAIRTPAGGIQQPADGLDRCIEGRFRVAGKTVVPVIVDVLCNAGITETTELIDRHAHRSCKGVRLLPPWTWDAGSGGARPATSDGTEHGDECSASSWMSMCPVCRTGILNRVTGKQLFGIPHTDFYIECTYCGAKFIPVGTQFRLVSIATVRDPLWRKYLDQTFPARTWSALARGNLPEENHSRPPVEKSPEALLQGRVHTAEGWLPSCAGRGKDPLFQTGESEIQRRSAGGSLFPGTKISWETIKNPVFKHLLPTITTRYSAT